MLRGLLVTFCSVIYLQTRVYVSGHRRVVRAELGALSERPSDRISRPVRDDELRRTSRAVNPPNSRADNLPVFLPFSLWRVSIHYHYRVSYSIQKYPYIHLLTRYFHAKNQFPQKTHLKRGGQKDIHWQLTWSNPEQNKINQLINHLNYFYIILKSK